VVVGEAVVGVVVGTVVLGGAGAVVGVVVAGAGAGTGEGTGGAVPAAGVVPVTGSGRDVDPPSDADVPAAGGRDVGVVVGTVGDAGAGCCEACDAFRTMTTDQVPHWSVTFPVTSPGAVSSENQYSGLPA
jgi:hypothetical protein